MQITTYGSVSIFVKYNGYLIGQIAVCSLGDTYLGELPLSKLPLLGRGSATHEARPVRFGENFSAAGVIVTLKENGLELVDPLTAVKYLQKFRSKNESQHVATMFRYKHELWLLEHFTIITRSGEASRWLRTQKISHDYVWEKNTLFLTVPIQVQAVPEKKPH